MTTPATYHTAALFAATRALRVYFRTRNDCRASAAYHRDCARAAIRAIRYHRDALRQIQRATLRDLSAGRWAQEAEAAEAAGQTLLAASLRSAQRLAEHKART